MTENDRAALTLAIARCRPALTAAVTAFEHSKGGTMSTAIERLRASKQKADQEENLHGKNEGRKWAADTAEYRWLQRLADRHNQSPHEKPRLALTSVLDMDEEELDPDSYEMTLRDRCYPLSRAASDVYLQAFIAGAVGFFEEVREQVESKPLRRV
jgi:hypothetical protein